MAGLPKVTITYGNGALSQAIASADGRLCLIVCGAETVADKFDLAKAYSIRKLEDLTDLGVDADNNPLLYQTVGDYYAEASDGTLLYVVGYPNTLTMSQVLDKNNAYAKTVLEEMNGEVRGLLVTKVATTEPDIVNGLDNDMVAAMLNAQALGDWVTEQRYAPIFTILDGLNFDGNIDSLIDLKAHRYNRVGVVIGTTTEDSSNQAIGFVGGRISASSVDNNIGRVADGALNTLTMYSKGTLIELADTETLYEKGYITFRTFTGVSGYFISDDILATVETDDYRHLTARRTIDKAYRIAYSVLLQKLLDKIAVKSDGTMFKPVIVSWQQDIENAIATNMTANGELSSEGEDDPGCKCYIDPTQNVLSRSKVNVVLRVRPFGYARYIDVLLGFTVVAQS